MSIIPALRSALSESPLFDEVWYRRTYPDAGRAVESGAAPSGLDHYLSSGAALGYVPCPYFDSDWYAAMNQDVSDGSASRKASSAFQHFVLYGQAEGRLPNAFFDPVWYARAHPRCRHFIEANLGSAFEHYCSFGAREKLAVSPYFFDDNYVERHPEIAAMVRGGMYPNGFSHYVLAGARSGLVANPFFEDAAYLSLNADVAHEPLFAAYPSPLSHYAHSGARRGKAPHDLFDSVWYLSAYPEARRAVEMGDFDSPFAHFCSVGHALGRRPGPRFDESYYLRRNPDVAEAIAKGNLHSGLAHYLRHGRSEGRDAHPFVPPLLIEALGARDAPPNWKSAASLGAAVPANVADLSKRDFSVSSDELAYFRQLVEEFPAEPSFRELGAYALLRTFDVAGAERTASDLANGGLDRACLVSAIRRLAGDSRGYPEFARRVERLLSDRLPFFEIDEPLPKRVYAADAVDFFTRGWLFHPCVLNWELSILIGSRRFPLEGGILRVDVHRRFEALDTLGASILSGFHGSVLAEADELGPPGTSVALKLCARSVESIDATERRFEVSLGELAIVAGRAAARPVRPSASGSSASIAICMAAFNPEPNLLARQIESIRAQSHEAWTLTISDESSDPARSDELGRIVDGDSRMTILRATQRRGFYFNFEASLAGAPGDARFIALADQDDYWYPEKLETLLSEVSRPGVALAFADMRVVTPEGEIISNTFWTERESHWEDPVELLLANLVTGAASMFRSELLERVLPFPVVRHLVHDQWIAMCAAGTGSIRFIDTPLHDYVQHGSNVIGAHAPGKTRATEWRQLYDRIRSPKNPTADFHTGLIAHCAHEWGEEPARLSHVLAVLQSRTEPRIGPRSVRIVDLLEQRLGQLGSGPQRKAAGVAFRICAAQFALEHARADSSNMLRFVRAEGADAERLRVVRPDCAAGRALGAPSRDAADDLVVKVLPLPAVIDASAPVRVDFLVSEIAHDTFAGSPGIFQLALRLARRGHRVRMICVDRTGSNVAEWLEIERTFPGLEGFFDDVEVVRGFGRAEKILFNPGDPVIASTWWTAHIAGKLVERLGRSRFLYLIEEYEPFRCPMGSWYAMAHESYALPHDALFSSSLLADYFARCQMGVFGPTGGRGASFSNAVPRFEAASSGARVGPRRLAYYCRPEGHAAGNMSEVGVAALRLAIEQGVFEGEDWEFWGLGTDSNDARRLGPHHELRQTKKVTAGEWQERLTQFDVGLSLMYTPHPSRVPIEMAAAGLLVVSNTCENKTERELLAISDRFVPCAPTIEGVVIGLRAAVKRLRAGEGRTLNGVNGPESWDEALNDDVMTFVEDCLRPPTGDARAADPPADAVRAGA
jgi:hypothetical protein